MTSASELFYSRRSRFVRPDPDSGLSSSVDRSLYQGHTRGQRQHHLHNRRHDLDGCDPLRRSAHLRHACPRGLFHPDRPSPWVDPGTSPFVARNGGNLETLNSTNRQDLSPNERLPGSVLLARARLLERLRGVSVSPNRRSGRASSVTYHRESPFSNEYRLVDAGDWGTATSPRVSAGASLFPDLTSQTERLQFLQDNNKKPPGLTQEALDNLQVDVFCSGDIVDDGKLSSESRDCSICLESFIEGDVLMRLPCSHWFHSVCLDPWIRTCGDCPYCRRGIL